MEQENSMSLFLENVCLMHVNEQLRRKAQQLDQENKAMLADLKRKQHAASAAPPPSSSSQLAASAAGLSAAATATTHHQNQKAAAGNGNGKQRTPK